MKRLFFGLEPFLPALELPSSRLLQEKDRHLTLVFLGNKEESLSMRWCMIFLVFF